jgi:hypothetical protein
MQTPLRSLRSLPPPQGGKQVIGFAPEFASPLTGEAGAQRREGVSVQVSAEL